MWRHLQALGLSLNQIGQFSFARKRLILNSIDRMEDLQKKI